MSEFLLGSDGLPARKAGEWAQEKLAFLETFIPPALQVTKVFRQRVFVDLFAGPGLNRTDRGEEFDGSPLVALQAAARNGITFTRAHFVNYHSKAGQALKARAEARRARGLVHVPEGEIEYHRGDANEAVDGILRSIPPQSAYVFAMADITGVKHWPFSTVRALRAHGHRALDLYVLFPLEQAIQRLVNWNGNEHAAFPGHLDAFFGTPKWREIYSRRYSSGQTATLKSELIALYRQQLGTLWRHVNVVAAPGRGGDARLYRMMYATDNAAADRIARGAAKSPRLGQRSLFD